MPPERLAKLPGYDPDVAKNRADARRIMQRLGYGPDKSLAVKVATRNIPLYRDPAVMLIDQLRRSTLLPNSTSSRRPTGTRR
jgi:peptide/nickel transport system substrate-binding protein